MDATTLFNLLVTCITVLTTSVSGLKCFQCKDVHANSDNSVIKFFLDQINSRNQYCGTAVREDTPEVQMITCPRPSAGKRATCTHLAGRSQASITIVSFSIDFNIRGCGEVPIAEADGCSTAKDRVQDESLLSSVISVTGLGIGSFDGTTCMCSSNLCNSQATFAPLHITWCFLLSLAALLFR